MTDPTITIAGLHATIESLTTSLDAANRGRAELSSSVAHGAAAVAAITAERDALAAQLAEVRAKLDAAPKVCAIHSYEHGPGPCMTCGAWPPGTRELIAACQTRIAGLEQAADERSAEVARLTARVAELEARPVLTEERLRGALFACADGASDAEVRAILAALGPVMPPAQDRADELVSAWRGICTDSATCDLDPAERMRRALASLGAPPTSPPAAIEMRLCEATRVVLRPGTLYRFTVDDGCEACRDAATTSPPAARPVFAGVSIDELCSVYSAAYGERPGHRDDRRPDAIRAVLARLEVSLVAPEFLRRIPLYTKHGPNGKGDPGPCDATCVKCEAERIVATLTAAGIPVTPEVGK